MHSNYRPAQPLSDLVEIASLVLDGLAPVGRDAEVEGHALHEIRVSQNVNLSTKEMILNTVLHYRFSLG